MNEPVQDPDTVAEYEIRVSGILSEQWSDWFDRMTIDYDVDGNTILVGAVIDQAALHGMLDKIRDLGLTLLSVTKRTA